MRNYMMRLSVLIVAALTFFASCSTEDTVGNVPAPNPNIAQIVALDPNFTILNAAVNRAGVASSLAADNITLLAPDNYSFYVSGIPDVNAVNNIPVATLRSILTYHIIPRRLPFNAIPASDTIRTVNLQNIYASRNTNGTFLNGITIKTRDRAGSNGVIQVPTRLLTPPAPTKSIASTIANDTTFSMLFRAVTKLNLLPVLENPNKLTVFAPNNAAFRAVGINDVDAVPVATLDAVVKSHVIGTNLWSTDLISTLFYNTLNPNERLLIVSTTPTVGVRLVSSTRPVSQVIAADNICTNGIIHTINRVLLR